MKTSILGWSVLALSLSAQADDSCSKAIFRLHDALTSKSALQVTAAFSGVMLVDKLELEGLTKDFFAAYTGSAEYKDSTGAFTSAVQEISKSCTPKGIECMKAAVGIANGLNEPRNLYGRARAADVLVRQTENDALIAASRKNLKKAEKTLAAAASSAIRPALEACR